jgi:hypothetical protein
VVEICVTGESVLRGVNSRAFFKFSLLLLKRGDGKRGNGSRELWLRRVQCFSRVGSCEYLANAGFHLRADQVADEHRDANDDEVERIVGVSGEGSHVWVWFSPEWGRRRWRRHPAGWKGRSHKPSRLPRQKCHATLWLSLSMPPMTGSSSPETEAVRRKRLAS